MKNLSFFLFVAILLTLNFGSCLKTEEQQCEGICINFLNKTSADINNPKVNSIAIPNLPFNGESGYVQFEKFTLDHGSPRATFIGEQNGKIVRDDSHLIWCGFGMDISYLESGYYEIELHFNYVILLKFK